MNRLGVDVNTASPALLHYVAGLNDRVARRIVEHRNGNGAFGSREQLKQVPGFGGRTFEQAAGFLRIPNGANPLDATAVHPESYAIVEKMAAAAGVLVAELIARPELVEQLKLDGLKTGSVGTYTLEDIRDELCKQGRDPRGSFTAPRYRDDVLQISDLKDGMELEGMVTNVTNFGAFVDVGVHQDGLVHVSEISERFIKDPREAVKVGDIVKVRVLSADVQAKRISLSMKPAPRPKPVRTEDRRPKAAARAGENGSGQPRRERAERPPRRQLQEAVAKSAGPKDGRRKDSGKKPAEASVAPATGQPKQPRQAPQKAKPMTMEEKLALLQSKFRTRV